MSRAGRRPRSPWANGLRRGLLLLLISHAVAFGLLSLVAVLVGGASQISAVLPILAVTILFWQWLYVLPLVLVLAIRKRWAVMQGVLLGALITTLLNGAACFGLIR